MARKDLPKTNAIRCLEQLGILDLDHIYLNGGHRGLLVRIDPEDLAKALKITPVQVAIA